MAGLHAESRPGIIARRIATHRKPDADAIAAARLAEAYLFAGEKVEVAFVPRCRPGTLAGAFDCVVDVSNTHDPERLVFDHTPPAFADRNATCATRLVWEHLQKLGHRVGHLAPLVRVVHEGDRSPPRRPSPELARSRAEGFHAEFSRLRARCNDDRGRYLALGAWLDQHDARTRARLGAVGASP